MELVKEFISQVSEKNELQKKYLESWKAEGEEKRELNTILHFFIRELGYDMSFITEAYLFINHMVMEETYFFIKNNRYRNSSFEEVNEIVYDNPKYMEKYMMGLSISDYIWINHIKILRYFEKNMGCFSGRYLEIGPGFGQYLVKALINGCFVEYHACDISKISVDRSNRYLQYRSLAGKCKVEEKDFFQYDSESKFHCIVMGEVLEHVERPQEMLEKVYGLLEDGGKAFVTTVINAPAVDHISLFRSIEDVLDLARNAGFSIYDYIYATEGDIPLEKAVKKRQAVNIAMILEKHKESITH